MFHDDDKWNSVSGAELNGFLEKVDAVDGKFPTSPETTEIHWRTLPFYKKVALVRLRDPNWDSADLTLYFLTYKGELTRLDGSSPPIHNINSEAPIALDENNILDYLRFFCYFVRGDEGPFLVSETMDDPAMPKDLDETTSKAIEGVLRPATYEGRNAEGHYMCDAIVFYSNALFLANFAIQPSGMIEMLEDDPLVTDLPVRVHSPIA